MTSITLKKTNAELQKIKNYYTPYLIDKNIPYSLFFAKKNNVTITAYTSGKILFQGEKAELEARRWIDNASKKELEKKGSLPTGFSQKSIIGSDEVGNGSYFGPLVVCAVYAETSLLPALKKLGVKDSKMLQDKQIRQIAKELETLVPHQLLNVTPQKYNEVQSTYNAVRMKVALHNQAIYLLLQKIAPKEPEAILIDQFTSERNYRNYLNQEAHPVTDSLYFITKGEQYHLAVAAASILSRAKFLDELDRASAELGFDIPSGAGYQSDQVAAKILRKGGLPLLSNYAKIHFQNTTKAQKLITR